MHILCRGDTTAIHTGWELCVLGPHAFRMELAPLHHHVAHAGAPPVLPPWFVHLPLALSPSGERIGVRAVRVDLADSAAVDEDLRVIEVPARIASVSTADALAFVSDEELMSLRPVASGSPERGVYRGPHGSEPVQVALPAATAVAWPAGAGRLWDSDVPSTEGALSRRATIAANAHGHTVVDADAGLVVRVAASGQATVHRVPSEGARSGMALGAFATPDGFVVAYSGGRGGGVVNHFSVDGRHLGALPAHGNLSDVVILDDVALVLRETSDASGTFELVVAALPSLAIVETVATTIATSDGYPGLGAPHAGEVWIGNGTQVQRLQRGARGWQAQPVDLARLPVVMPRNVPAREARAAATPASVPRAHGELTREVVHAKFGTGRVVQQDGHGEQAKLTIEFADGVRVLLARFVRPAP